MDKGIAFEQVALIVIVIVTVVAVLLFFFTQMSNVNEPLDTTTTATDFNSKIAAAEAKCFPSCTCNSYQSEGLYSECFDGMSPQPTCPGIIKSVGSCSDCCISPTPIS